MLLALLGVAFFLAHCGRRDRGGQGLCSRSGIIPSIADSVFCQQVAGRQLEALLDRLTPEQLAAVHATPAPSDLRALAAEMRAKLEALG